MSVSKVRRGVEITLVTKYERQTRGPSTRLRQRATTARSGRNLAQDDGGLFTWFQDFLIALVGSGFEFAGDGEFFLGVLFIAYGA
jgi:hypothetical protein